MNMTYYDTHAKEFIESTKNCNMELQYNMLLKYVKKGKMLDIGFGSGRDMLYFKSLGFDVTGIDPTNYFVNYAKGLGLDVIETKLEDYETSIKYDALWACASLLHFENLNEALIKVSSLLKKNGYLYASFKYGKYIGYRNDRFFIDMDESEIFKYLKNTNLKLLEYIVNNDAHEYRKSELWINFIFKKTK